MRDDEVITRELDHRLEEVIRHYWPNAIFRGASAFPCPKNQADLGSFEVCLRGAKRGVWARPSVDTKFGGGTLALVAYGMSGESSITITKAVFDECRSLLGLSENKPAPVRTAPPKERLQEAPEFDALAAARKIWDASVPGQGTPAEAYLRFRVPRLTRIPDAVRYLPAARWRAGDARGESPAMILGVFDHQGRFCGIHRTFITADGRKADHLPVPVKMTLGPVYGDGDLDRAGFVALQPIQGDVVLVEGFENACTVWAACGRAVVAALAINNLAVRLPEAVERVAIVFDADEALHIPELDKRLAARRRVLELKRAAVAAHRARGLDVTTVSPPIGFDIGDLPFDEAARLLTQPPMPAWPMPRQLFAR